jgi:hypothetical protein
MPGKMAAADSLARENPFFQMHRYSIANLFLYETANLGFHRQLVSTIAKSHEGTFEWDPVDRTPHLYQSARAEKLRGFGPDYVRPSPCVRAPLQFGCEALVQHREILTRR